MVHFSCPLLVHFYIPIDIAEYRPQENSYFYYATDQIGSTRIVTDDTGAVVYAAAHDPWGGIQQTWTSAYDPALKFSGKERDTESGLDYFGARYYDHSLYRFLSVDPVIPAGKAVFNPQRWNLYGYCLGNPISFFDLGGAYPVHISIVRTGIAPSGGIMGTFTVETPYAIMMGFTLEPAYLGDIQARTEESGSAIMPGTYSGNLVFDRQMPNGQIIDSIELFGAGLGSRRGILIHNGSTIGDTTGCILVGFGRNSMTGALSSGARQEILNLIEAGSVLAIPNQILDVLIGFASLLSIADFPEITVTISVSPAFVQTIVNIVSGVFLALPMI